MQETTPTITCPLIKQYARYLEKCCVLPEQESGSSPSHSNGVKRSDERLPHQQWQGKSTQFMRSNEHSRERAGVWNTQGLEGPALALVKGDEQSGRCVHEHRLLIFERPLVILRFRSACHDNPEGCAESQKAFCWCSWLRKLQLVKDVLVDKTAGAPDLNTLANAYIYLQVCCWPL